jgi:hypothetical protein
MRKVPIIWVKSKKYTAGALLELILNPSVVEKTEKAAITTAASIRSDHIKFTVAGETS